MSKIKRFLSLSLLMIGVLVGVSFPTHFSVAQSYGPENNLLDKLLNFIMPNYTIYLYAITEPNTYTISFDGNGSTAGSMGNMNMTYDEKSKLLANNFTRDGFVFKGWSTSKTGAVEYTDQSEVKNLTAENLGEVILYAQRDGKVPYIVEYYQENIAGTGYDLVFVDILYGTSNTQVPPIMETYTGFTLQTGAEININSDGSTVAPYYYTRNTYNLTVKDRDIVILNTGIKYGADITLPDNLTWTGNTFAGWDNLPTDGKMPADNLTITSKWTYGEHTITFNTNGGTELAPITANYGEPINPPATPTREGYEFVGWSPALPSTMPYDDITVIAIWKQKNKGTGWSGRGGKSGGGTSSATTVSEGEGQHGAATDQPSQGIINVITNKGDLEVVSAYLWAYRKGIIGTGRRESDPDGYLTRGDMAEMVVKFTENVLGRKIPSKIPTQCKRGDAEREWKSPEAKVYAEKACALGIMGIRMENFMPNKALDRAEFGTILSRLLWGDKYDVVNATETNLYYSRHLEALNRAGIMKDVYNPTSRKELRKRAWLMMMRVRE